VRHSRKPARRLVGAVTQEAKRAVRTEALAAQGGRCAYCGRPLRASEATIDHVRPLSRGGADDQSNVVAACRPCNEAKDDMAWTPKVAPPG
jgi:5-methylcytosine-specific restriction endonuclease McrA